MTEILMALDIGSVRIGVSVSDGLGMLAHPLTTLKMGKKDTLPIGEIQSLIREKNVRRLIVGMPYTMKGTDSLQTAKIKEYVLELEKALTIPVETIDERLTTKMATEQLRAVGKKGSKNRNIIDQVAAVNILQLYLDKEKINRRVP
ncbi:MAG TPA: Holliday junction resolvase RuvX [Caldithrix abyssi]|uniref:Putative pre-16S rRNA nuclease n=1 Tax=Caldithrix abyssi TaxID=187145 RepID=A0A7V1LNQ5_CALAY|nr:Holliday junction resolvase RuvX [Caldithrix abyssi]